MHILDETMHVSKFTCDGDAILIMVQSWVCHRVFNTFDLTL